MRRAVSRLLRYGASLWRPRGSDLLSAVDPRLDALLYAFIEGCAKTGCRRVRVEVVDCNGVEHAAERMPADEANRGLTRYSERHPGER